MKQLLSNCSASISALRKNPIALINEAKGSPIAILNHNRPVAYLISAETYERLMDKLENSEFAQFMYDRAHEKNQAIEINIDDL